MDADGSRQDLEDLERTRLRALVAGDATGAASLHADDYELVTPGGATLSKAAYLGSIADGSIRYERFEPIGAVRVRSLGDTAILRYQVRIDIVFGDDNEHGEYWHTDYWERRAGRWQAVWSHATRIRPP